MSLYDVEHLKTLAAYPNPTISELATLLLLTRRSNETLREQEKLLKNRIEQLQHKLDMLNDQQDQWETTFDHKLERISESIQQGTPFYFHRKDEIYQIVFVKHNRQVMTLRNPHGRKLFVLLTLTPEEIDELYSLVPQTAT